MKISFRPPRQDPTVVHGLKVAYAPAKRKAAQWRWYAILLCVSSPLLYFLFQLLLAWLIVGAPGFIVLDRIAVNSTSTGTVLRLTAGVGERLTAGQTVAQLFNPEMDSQLAQYRAELDTLAPTESKWDLSARRRLMQQKVRLAGENLEAGHTYLQNVIFLFDQGAATAAELNLARERYNRVRMEADQARFELDLLPAAADRIRSMPEDGSGPARARLAAKIAALTDEQERLTQRAPYSGRVLELIATEGSVLSPGAPILLLGRTDKPYVIAYLDPKYTRYARHGQRAEVRLGDGTVLPAMVRDDATLTKRLPADLSSPIGSRDMMLWVNLDLEAPLPDIQWVDALPVSVRFAFRFF
jgi:multidrug resistance efflux pump